MEFEVYKPKKKNEEDKDNRSFKGHKAYTGFPNQASDELLLELDFNEMLVTDKNAINAIVVRGGPYPDCALTSGDVLVVDRVMIPENDSTVVVIIEGDLAIRKFENKNGVVKLYRLTGNFSPYTCPEDFPIYGVVIFVIQKMKMKFYRRLSALNLSL